jgi:hypothetical protein
MKERIIVVVLLLVVGLSCQTPVQPTPSTIPVTRTVQIRDGSGNDFQGANVQLHRADAFSQGTFVTTGPNGEAIFTASVPPGFLWYICFVSASASYSTVQDSVLLGCNDTTLEFTLVKQVTLPCVSASDQDSAKCHVCLGPGATDSAFTPWLSFTCPNALAVSATSAGAAQIMSVTYFKKSGGVTTGPFFAPPSPLNPGDQIQAKIIYKPTVASSPTDIFTLILTFSGGGTTITYAFKVTGTAENCANCNCPATDFIASLPKPDTVCVNSSKDTAIDLSTVSNPGDKTTCSWLFTLEQDFPDNSEIILSTRSFTLQGGSSLSSIRLTFSPQQNKVYDEYATFNITTQPQNGVGTPCSHVLKIHFVGFGSGPSCSIEASNLLNTVTINGIKYNLQACAGQTGSNTLKIKNTGACPVQNITLSFLNPPGTMWQVTPANILSIAPGDSVIATVEFSPSLKDVYPPNGDICNPNPPTTTFTNTLIVNGCGNSPSSYPLTAYGDPNCHPSASFFLPDYQSKHEGIQIDSGTNVVHVQPQGDTTTWFLYATNLVSGVSVTLHGGIVPGAGGGVLALFSPTRVGTATSAAGDACMIGCQYKGQCGLSVNGVSSVVALPGDVFLFTFWTNGQMSGLAPHCGVIHVGDIHTDANLGYTVADLDVCFPIN